MTDERLPQAGDEQHEAPALPKHLAVLVGALEGPADLGRNHDKYLAYPHGDGEAAS